MSGSLNECRRHETPTKDKQLAGSSVPGRFFSTCPSCLQPHRLITSCMPPTAHVGSRVSNLTPNSPFITAQSGIWSRTILQLLRHLHTCDQVPGTSGAFQPPSWTRERMNPYRPVRPTPPRLRSRVHTPSSEEVTGYTLPELASRTPVHAIVRREPTSVRRPG